MAIRPEIAALVNKSADGCAESKLRSRAGQLQGVDRYQPPRVRVHRQHGALEGHGSQQVLFPVLSEGHRRGELPPLQPGHRPAPGPFHAAAVGEDGGVGASTGTTSRSRRSLGTLVNVARVRYTAVLAGAYCAAGAGP